jgi:altronate dehydratase
MPREQPDALIINENHDNVATSLKALRAGQMVRVRSGSSMIELKLIQDVTPGHKFALHDIKRGAHIIKYGEVIGIATSDISKGAHVHVHNMASLHGRSDSDPFTEVR